MSDDSQETAIERELNDILKENCAIDSAALRISSSIQSALNILTVRASAAKAAESDLSALRGRVSAYAAARVRRESEATAMLRLSLPTLIGETGEAIKKALKSDRLDISLLSPIAERVSDLVRAGEVPVTDEQLLGGVEALGARLEAAVLQSVFRLDGELPVEEARLLSLLGQVVGGSDLRDRLAEGFDRETASREEDLREKMENFKDFAHSFGVQEDEENVYTFIFANAFDEFATALTRLSAITQSFNADNCVSLIEKATVRFLALIRDSLFAFFQLDVDAFVLEELELVIAAPSQSRPPRSLIAVQTAIGELALVVRGSARLGDAFKLSGVAEFRGNATKRLAALLRKYAKHCFVSAAESAELLWRVQQVFRAPRSTAEYGRRLLAEGLLARAKLAAVERRREAAALAPGDLELGLAADWLHALFHKLRDAVAAATQSGDAALAADFLRFLARELLGAKLAVLFELLGAQLSQSAAFGADGLLFEAGNALTQSGAALQTHLESIAKGETLTTTVCFPNVVFSAFLQLVESAANYVSVLSNKAVEALREEGMQSDVGEFAEVCRRLQTLGDWLISEFVNATVLPMAIELRGRKGYSPGMLVTATTRLTENFRLASLYMSERSLSVYRHIACTTLIRETEEAVLGGPPGVQLTALKCDLNACKDFLVDSLSDSETLSRLSAIAELLAADSHSFEGAIAAFAALLPPSALSDVRRLRRVSL